MKRIIKVVFTFLPYAGLVFLIIYLVKKDFDWQLLNGDFNYLLLSMIMLLNVFIIRGYAWNFILKCFGYQFSLRETLRSQFSSTLLKYIPGKVWVPIGKATQLVEDRNEVIKISSIAFLQQLLFTSWGLILGSLSLGFIWPEIEYIWLIYIFVFILIVFGLFVHSRKWQISRPLPKPFSKLNRLTIPSTIKLVPLIIAQWAILGLAFLITYLAFNPEIPFEISAVQVLANNIGMVVLFVPGGLGVREGIVGLYLNNIGLASDQIIALLIGSRLWFIVGEFIIFIGTYMIKNENGGKAQ